MPTPHLVRHFSRTLSRSLFLVLDISNFTSPDADPPAVLPHGQSWLSDLLILLQYRESSPSEEDELSDIHFRLRQALFPTSSRCVCGSDDEQWRKKVLTWCVSREDHKQATNHGDLKMGRFRQRSASPHLHWHVKLAQFPNEVIYLQEAGDSHCGD